MERLTNKREADAQREEYERRLANGYPRNIPEERFLRLAAYEDSGCEPEEVLPKDKADEIALKLMRIADLESFCSYDRLRELAEADKDGRCVVLPCKGYSDVDIVRDGVSYRPDHWNIHLTAYAHEQNTPSGLKVGLFGIGEVERAMEGRKDG